MKTLKKSEIEGLLQKGLKASEVAKELGISVLTLKDGCKKLGINLRKKPRVKGGIEFVDDSVQESTSQNTTKEAKYENNVKELTEPAQVKFESTLVPDITKEDTTEEFDL